MPNRRLIALVFASLALSPSIGSAQVINRPERAYRGLFGGNRATDPNRSRQELTFTLNALGGYDDNAAAGEGLGAPTTVSSDGGGNTGTVDAALSYFRGKGDRSLTFSIGGGAQVYRNVALDPNQSAVATLQGMTTLGRRSRLLVNEALRYTNQYHIDAPITGGTPLESLPTTDTSVFGLGNRSSITNAAGASLDHRVGRADTLTGTYSFTTTSYTDDELGGYRAHRTSARYGHQVGRWTQVDAEYGYSRTRFAFTAGDAGRPMTEQRIVGGLTWDKRLSARRSLQVTAGAGALNLDSLTGDAVLTPFNIWAPYATFGAQLDLSRDWNLGGNYRRGAETLEGLTRDPFLNDGGTVTLSGLVSRRVDLSFLAGFARGAQAAESTGPESTYTTATGSAQVRIAISRTLSTIVSYHFYHYEFENTALPIGVPSDFDRSAVRVGLAVWLPLYSGYTRSR